MGSKVRPGTLVPGTGFSLASLSARPVRPVLPRRSAAPALVHCSSAAAVPLLELNWLRILQPLIKPHVCHARSCTRTLFLRGT